MSITEGARAKLRKAGIWGYKILDHQMIQTAYFEGCNTLVCTVRGGPNRNTARERHIKLGWRPVDYAIHHGIPGGNPVEVLVRCTSEGEALPQDFIPPAPTDWGENPHYRPHAFWTADESLLTTAPTMADCEARAICEDFVRERGLLFSGYHGFFSFYLRFQSQSAGRITHLQQLRPGFDIWYCDGPRGAASLREHLADLAVKSPRRIGGATSAGVAKDMRLKTSG